MNISVAFTRRRGAVRQVEASPTALLASSPTLHSWLVPLVEENVRTDSAEPGNVQAVEHLHARTPGKGPEGSSVHKREGSVSTERVEAGEKQMEAQLKARRAHDGASEGIHACAVTSQCSYDEGDTLMTSSPHATVSSNASMPTTIESPQAIATVEYNENPREVSRIPQPTVALVFGREESGLTGEELAACSHACAIPTGRLQPSMNLSHSVAAVLAQLFERCSSPVNSACFSIGMPTPPGHTNDAEFSSDGTRSREECRTPLLSNSLPSALAREFRTSSVDGTDIWGTSSLVVADQRRLQHENSDDFQSRQAGDAHAVEATANRPQPMVQGWKQGPASHGELEALFSRLRSIAQAVGLPCAPFHLSKSIHERAGIRLDLNFCYRLVLLPGLQLVILYCSCFAGASMEARPSKPWASSRLQGAVGLPCAPCHLTSSIHLGPGCRA